MNSKTFKKQFGDRSILVDDICCKITVKHHLMFTKSDKTNKSMSTKEVIGELRQLTECFIYLRNTTAGQRHTS